ncbi:MBL fold metallo-hydrolase [bacterium]|nr:MAG: MBL fold metallo-hydrolase [bacterium]
MTIRFLGTGTSYGVPYVGCDCAVCRSTDPRDKRLRASVLVEESSEQVVTRLLVDTGPDFRQQMLRAQVNHLTAILWTHSHNDHIIGLDDVRPLSDKQGYVPGYSDARTNERLQAVFDYCFVQDREHPGYPRITPHIVAPFETLQFDAIAATPFPISHGRAGEIFAWEFAGPTGRFVYASDCAGIPDASLECMKGCDVFVVDALRHTAHPNHFNIAQALEAIEKIDPQRAFFTHITHELGHVETEATLPERVRIAYDGLELTI